MTHSPDAAPIVAALFVDQRSVYKRLPHVDPWDKVRDARLWPGGVPVIAHPPCRLWCKLRYFSTAPAEEKELAVWAVAQVRRWGGVLEHPALSTLWEVPGLALSKPGRVDGRVHRDAHGGWTLAVPQFWWGHMARKNTWLYIVGCPPLDLPPIPLRLGDAEYTVGGTRDRQHKGKPEMPKSLRHITPPALAAWLVDLAKRCHKQEHQR